ncbi:hypothetical protein EYF80_010499 [Liparis tanakae]|uniref:Uncharacterized protein n=1 Tax=Liparis tanakae TaxID=230148 RepID=A0A4Z2IP68_9TELE|nr:hypothetical protein EYF80_010499 [Liparis tanakae]
MKICKCTDTFGRERSEHIKADNVWLWFAEAEGTTEPFLRIRAIEIPPRASIPGPYHSSECRKAARGNNTASLLTAESLNAS